MKWVLVSPMGHIVREAEAESLAEARFRLAPIPAKHHVQSRVTYAGPLRTPQEVKSVRKLLARSSAARRKRNSEAQARWRAKKMAQDAAFDAKRRHAHRVATSAKLAEVSGVMVGMMIEGVDERTIAKRFGVAQQSVSNIRQLYRVPTTRTIRRKQVEVLAKYYATQGYALYEIANRCEASPRMVRQLLAGGTDVV